MAWGYGTTVEDTEVYEGQPDLDLSSGLQEDESHTTASSSGPVTLNETRLADKVSFYLDEGNFGATFSDSPYDANFNINEQGQVGWGGSVTEESGPFNAKVGLLGQGMQFSPYANLGINPIEGLNLNVQGQSYPGGYSELNPSASYQNQFNTPWGTGLLNANIGRQGGRTVGGFQVRGDF